MPRTVDESHLDFPELVAEDAVRTTAEHWAAGEPSDADMLVGIVSPDERAAVARHLGTITFSPLASREERGAARFTLDRLLILEGRDGGDPAALNGAYLSTFKAH